MPSIILDPNSFPEHGIILSNNSSNLLVVPSEIKLNSIFVSQEILNMKNILNMLNTNITTNTSGIAANSTIITDLQQKVAYLMLNQGQGPGGAGSPPSGSGGSLPPSIISDLVLITGNQTIIGIKTFSLSPIVPDPQKATEAANKEYVDNKIAPLMSADQQNVKLTSNQTVYGVKTFHDPPKLPDPTNDDEGANKKYVDTQITTASGHFVILTGDQTIAGIKTFSNSPVVPEPTLKSQVANMQYVDDQITAASIRYVNLVHDQSVDGVKTFTSPPKVPTPQVNEDVANKTYVDSEISTAVSKLVDLKSAQSIEGIKTFVDSPSIPSPFLPRDATNKEYVDNKITALIAVDTQTVKITGNQDISGVKSFTDNINVIAPTQDTHAANKKYVDDHLTSNGANFVKLSDSQSINGVKTFTSPPKVPTPRVNEDAVNKTYVDNNITTATGRLVDLTTSQSISGVKHFTVSPEVPIPSSDNQVSNKKYIDDKIATESGNFVKLSGDQSIDNVKTFTSPPIVPNPVKNTDAVNKTYVDSEISTAVSKLVDINSTQSITGVKTFTVAPVISIAPRNSTEAVNKQYVDDKFAILNTADQQNVKLTTDQSIGGVKTFVSSPVVPTPQGDTDVANKKYIDDKVSSSILLNNGNLVNLSTTQKITGEKTFSVSPIVPDPTLNTQAVNKKYVDNEILTKDNQNVKLTGNQTINGIKTFTSPLEIKDPIADTQAVSKQYFNRELASNNLSLVNLASPQTITGVKTFSVQPIIPDPQQDGQAANKKYVDTQITTASNYFVKLTGDQDIAGVKNFTSNIKVIIPTRDEHAANKGYVDSQISSQNTANNANFVDKTNAQTINGVKTFHDPPEVPDPTNNPQAANKKYVDTKIATASHDYVNLTANQNIDGVKTFRSKPIVPTPTQDNEAANKGYVDSRISSQINTNNVNFVGLASVQNITGVKTFDVSPKVPDPTNDEEVANKRFVNTEIATAGRNYVNLTDNQDVNGVKTFHSPPIVPTPNQNTEAANKQYVDNKVNDGNTNTISTINSTIDSTCVKLTGNQTIAGQKTFSDQIIAHKLEIPGANKATDDTIINFQGDAIPVSTTSVDFFRVYKGSTKTCRISVKPDQASGNDNFLLTFPDKIEIQNISDPQGNTWAVNKGYVDSHITSATDTCVKLNGVQTINNVKNFSASPTVPTPTGNTDVANKGYVDTTFNNAVSLSSAQEITSVKTFRSSPIVPDPQHDGEAANKKYIDDRINLVNTSGSTNYVNVTADQDIAGVKNFTGYVKVVTPQQNEHASNKKYVDDKFGLTTDLASVQSITGEKTFTVPPKVPTPRDDTDAANKKYIDDHITTASNNYVNVTANQQIGGVKTFSVPPIVPTPTGNTEAANKEYVDNKITTVVDLASAQNIAGVKTFDVSPIVPTPRSNNNAANKEYVDTTITSQIHTNNANFVDLTTAQFVGGVKSFTSIIKGITPVDNDDIANKEYVDTAINTQITANNVNYVDLASAQDITGIKTFTHQPIVPDPIASNQVANKKYVDDTITTASASFVLAAGTQTINGVKTFHDPPEVPTPTSSNQAVNKEYVDNNFVDKTTIQSIDGVKTFVDPPIVPDPSADGEAANKGYVDTTISSQITANNANFVNVTSTQNVDGQKTFLQNIVLNKAIDFNGAGRNTDSYFMRVNCDSMTASQTNIFVIWKAGIAYSIKLIKESGNNFKIQFPNLVELSNITDPTQPTNAANKQYVDNNFVDKTTAQTIAGVKTFSSSPEIPEPTTDGQAATKHYVDSTCVQLTGDQTIAGIKNFSVSPTVPNPTNNTDVVNLQYLTSRRYACLTSTDTFTVTMRFQGDIDLTGKLLLGKNNHDAVIRPFHDRAIPLKFYGTNSACYFNLDLGSRGKVINTADPTDDADGANKRYVDTNCVNLTTDQSIAGTKTFSGAVKVPTPTVDEDAVNIAYFNTRLANMTNGAIDVRIINLENADQQNVKITGDQRIEGVKTFVSSPIVPDPTNNTDAANKQWTRSNCVVLSNDAQTVQGTKSFANNIDARGGLMLGFGYRYGSIYPDDNSVKDLNLFHPQVSANPNRYFNLNFDNRGKIINLKDPTAAADGANKRYVDSNCVKLTGNQTIAGDKSFNNMAHFYGCLDVPADNLHTNDFVFRIQADRMPTSTTSLDFFRMHVRGTYSCRICVRPDPDTGADYYQLVFVQKTVLQNIPDPGDASWAANKRYVDNKVAQKTVLIGAANEVKFFATQQAVTDFASTYNLVAGTDYNQVSQNPTPAGTLAAIQFLREVRRV